MPVGESRVTCLYPASRWSGCMKGEVHWIKHSMSTSGRACRNSWAAATELAVSPALSLPRSNTSTSQNGFPSSLPSTRFTLAPQAAAHSAIPRWSVDTQTESNLPNSKMDWSAQASSGLEPSGAKFFRGRPYSTAP